MDNNATPEKIYTAETIGDTAFPGNPADMPITDPSLQVTSSTNTAPSTIPKVPDQNFPTLLISEEVLSTAFNTRTKKIIQEFQFTPGGAIAIGDFEIGVSGDVRISPEGIVGRNNLGDTTFLLDSETGDAIFAGEIRSGSVVTGIVRVGSTGNVVIDGENERIVIFDASGVARVLIGYLKGGF